MRAWCDLVDGTEVQAAGETGDDEREFHLREAEADAASWASAEGHPCCAMARAKGLLRRVRDTPNATFQTLAGDLLRSVVRGTRVPADDLGPLLPFLELPDTSWSGLAVRAGYVRSLGIEGRREAAITALEPVIEALDVAPGYAENSPLIVAYCVDALWTLNCTDGLDRLERNLREKVVEPDVRYHEVDGRWSPALACALTGRVAEAEHWFGEARRVLAEQETVPLRVAIDLEPAS